MPSRFAAREPLKRWENASICPPANGCPNPCDEGRGGLRTNNVGSIPQKHTQAVTNLQHTTADKKIRRARKTAWGKGQGGGGATSKEGGGGGKVGGGVRPLPNLNLSCKAYLHQVGRLGTRPAIPATIDRRSLLLSAGPPLPPKHLPGWKIKGPAYKLDHCS